MLFALVEVRRDRQRAVGNDIVCQALDSGQWIELVLEDLERGNNAECSRRNLRDVCVGELRLEQV